MKSLQSTLNEIKEFECVKYYEIHKENKQFTFYANDWIDKKELHRMNINFHLVDNKVISGMIEDILEDCILLVDMEEYPDGQRKKIRYKIIMRNAIKLIEYNLILNKSKEEEEELRNKE